MTDGKLTYNRILNATQYEIERFLKEWGYKEYIGYSKYYLADFFREKAILRGKDYYV